MSAVPVEAGFIPLVDAAPLVIACELGFAEEEGIDLHLSAAPSWSTLRDRLMLEQIDAAHMLYPMPVAAALGLGGIATRLDILMVLSMNGNAIGVSRALADKMRAEGYGFDFADAWGAGRALIAAAGGDRLRVGVPFPFSMHAELLYHWFTALGLRAPQDLDVHTVPPPLMAEALGEDQIDAFCVGAPWGSLAVETGVGELLLPGTAIRASAPEKVLAVRHDWAEGNPVAVRRLMRAVWRAGRWLGQTENRNTAAVILAQKDYLDLPSEVLERALSGNMVISPRGDVRHVPGYLEFNAGAAGYPWTSQAELVADRLAERLGLERRAAMAAGAGICRTDLYRAALADLGAEIPLATGKAEGDLNKPASVPALGAKVTLPRDVFFDGWIFDPEKV